MGTNSWGRVGSPPGPSLIPCFVGFLLQLVKLCLCASHCDKSSQQSQRGWGKSRPLRDCLTCLLARGGGRMRPQICGAPAAKLSPWSQTASIWVSSFEHLLAPQWSRGNIYFPRVLSDILSLSPHLSLHHPLPPTWNLSLGVFPV